MSQRALAATSFKWSFKSQKLNRIGLNNIFRMFQTFISEGNYMFKVNCRNTRTRCEMCSKLTIKTPERLQWHHSDVFIVNFEHMLMASFWSLYCWPWTYFTPCSSVSIVNFGQINAGWTLCFYVIFGTYDQIFISGR